MFFDPFHSFNLPIMISKGRFLVLFAVLAFTVSANFTSYVDQLPPCSVGEFSLSTVHFAEDYSSRA
jgi:hypothetical protein